MIFPSLSLETTLQVEDKTRINASRSFVNNGETIIDVLIKPEDSEAYISVFNSNNDKWFLDWAYITDGQKNVSVKVTTDVTPLGRERVYQVDVLTVEDDTLFSSDSDLLPWEVDILNYLPKGKNSYLYAHRKSQDTIIAYLDEQRYWKKDSSRITKEDIASISDNEIRKQFNEWSSFQTLLIIFESIQVSNNDIFEAKKTKYEALRNSARSRSALRLDLDGDSKIDSNPYDIRTLRMIRR